MDKKPLRRYMEICPHCGALESARIYATRRDEKGNVCRFRKCTVCKKSMPSEVLFLPEKE